MKLNFDKKSHNSKAQLDNSIKTQKTITNYNLSDFLPPSHDHSQSRNITLPPKYRQKMHTQPLEKQKDPQFNQLGRKIENLEQEKLILSVQVQRSKRDLSYCRQNLCEKQGEVQSLKKKIEENTQMIKNLSKKCSPHLVIQRNILQIQMLPKFKQAYQVSVQTDPYFEKQQLTKQTRISSNASSDMQHIYQKLQNLKMGKRSSKPEVINTQHHPMYNLKTERIKPSPSNWFNDKQNAMRTSNLMEKRNIQKAARDETLQIYCMPIQIGEKMLAAYLDQSYI